MLELEDLTDENGVSLQKHNIAINTISEFLKVELPSFEDIEKFKAKGLDNIVISTANDGDQVFVDIARNEIERLIDAKEDIGSEDKFKYRLAMLYKNIGDFEKEFEILNSIPDIKKKPMFYNKLAQNVLKKNIDAGIKKLLSQSDIDAIVNLSLAYLQKKDVDKAIKLISKLYKKNEYEYKINITFSLISIILNDYRTAIKLLKEITKLDRYDDNICYLLSLSYYLNENIDKAKYYAMIGININNLNKDLLLLYSELAIKSNDFSAAPFLQRYAEIKNDEIIWEKLSWFTFHNQQYSRTIEILNILLAFNDSNPSTWNNLALTYEKIGKKEKCSAIYLQALNYIDKNRDFVIIHNFFKFLFNNNKFEELIKSYETLDLNHLNIDLILKHYPIHNIYFASLLKINEYDLYVNRIVELYEISNDIQIKINILNDLICLYSNVAYDIHKMNQYASDLTQYLDTVTEKDKRLRLINNLLFVDLECGNEIDYNMLEYFRSNLSNNPYYNATYGLYYLKLNNIERGTYYYNKSVQFTTNSELINKLKLKKNLEIGKAYLRMDRISNAKRFLTKVSKSNNSSSYNLEAKLLLKEIMQKKSKHNKAMN